MEDTVTLARQEREKQGPWEAEISYGGEVDLHQHLTGCDKNPGHNKFIPVDKFNVDHLPPGCSDNLVDLVRAISDLTVRVSVKYVSDSRPKTVPGSNEPFPCYNDSCKDMLRTGTGSVNEVKIYPDKHDKGFTTCTCKECVNSPTPKTQFAHIHIHTATHVVYDDLEAAHTTCHLFFDKGNKPEIYSGIVITLSGFSVARCELERDWCDLRYVTHDLELAERLNKILSSYTLIRSSIEYQYKYRLSTEPTRFWKPCLPQSTLCHLLNTLDTETIIVSHPHGCSKQVSFGRCTNLETREDGMTKFTYTTPTCPGSSGALVCLMNRAECSVYDGFVHSGCECEYRQQLNYSAYGKYKI